MIPTTEQIEKQFIPRLKKTFGANIGGMSGKDYDSDIAALSARIDTNADNIAANSLSIASLSAAIQNIGGLSYIIGTTAPANFDGLFFDTSNY